VPAVVGRQINPVSRLLKRPLPNAASKGCSLRRNPATNFAVSRALPPPRPTMQSGIAVLLLSSTARKRLTVGSRSTLSSTVQRISRRCSKPLNSVANLAPDGEVITRTHLFVVTSSRAQIFHGARPYANPFRLDESNRLQRNFTWFPRKILPRRCPGGVRQSLVPLTLELHMRLPSGRLCHLCKTANQCQDAAR
jgi:hypothetical protein